MASKRLSNLQKKILKLLSNGEKIRTHTLIRAIYSKGDIYMLSHINYSRLGYKQDFLSVQKSVLRSLDNLESKGMIINHRLNNGRRNMGSYKKSSQITNKGKSLIVEMISIGGEK